MTPLPIPGGSHVRLLSRPYDWDRDEPEAPITTEPDYDQEPEEQSCE